MNLSKRAGSLLILISVWQLVLADSLASDNEEIPATRHLLEHDNDQRSTTLASLRHWRRQVDAQTPMLRTSNSSTLGPSAEDPTAPPSIDAETESIDYNDSPADSLDVSSNGTIAFRYGRTSQEAGMQRALNPLIVAEMLSDKGDNGAIEFVLRLDTSDDIEFPSQGPLYLGEVISRNGSMWVERAITQEMDHFHARRDGDVNAAPTWNGQPSQLRPKTPYEPSQHQAKDYGDIMSKSLWFYQVQRSGILVKSPRPITWRNDSALKDGFDNRIDLTGGYYDAGDYLKFIHPLGSAMTMLAWSGVDHWQGILKSDNIGYWDETLRWGFDWIMKAHPDKDTLYVQVGDGNVDNNYWGGDQTIPTPRPSFFINRAKPGTDAAAGAATALAAGAIFYSAVIGDHAYAETLLQHSLSLYYFAESAPKRVYQKSVPQVKDWYASSDYSANKRSQDELTLGALMLFRATRKDYFLQRAELYFKKYKLSDNRDPVDWDSKHALCFLLGAQLVQQNGIQSKIDWKGALSSYLSETAIKQSKTPGGLLYYQGSSEENSIPTALGVTYVMTEYARLFPMDGMSLQLRQLADTQIDYVFGKNPRQMTYVVGVTSKSPKNPQSAMASGGNDIGNVDHSPPQMAHVLYGGLVGGPAKDDSFQDRRSNYKQSECALDYNGPLTAIMAGEFELGKTPFFARQAK